MPDNTSFIYINSSVLSTFKYGFPIILLDKYRIYLLMSGYQLFFVHSVRIHCGLKKLPVMILSDVSSEPHLLSSMPPVSHWSIVIDFVQQQLCLRPDTETAHVIASKNCPLGVVLTTYGAKQGFCTRSAMVYFCLRSSTLLVTPRLYSLCNTAIVSRQE